MGRLEIQGDRLPVYIAAGPIKTKADFKLIAKNEIIAGVIAGTFTAKERVNPKPEFEYKDGLATNRMGFPNPGRKNASTYLPENIKRLKAAGMQVLISVGAADDEHPMEVIPEMAEWAMEMGADGVEINPLCPNLDQDFDFRDPGRPLQLSALTRGRIGLEPALLFKVPNLSDFVIHKMAPNILVDGWSTINSLAGRSGPQMRGISRINTRHWVKALQDSYNTHTQVMSVLGIEGTAAGGKEAYEAVHGLGAFAVGMAQHPYRTKRSPKLFNKVFEDFHDGWQAAAQEAQE